MNVLLAADVIHGIYQISADEVMNNMVIEYPDNFRDKLATVNPNQVILTAMSKDDPIITELETEYGITWN